MLHREKSIGIVASYRERSRQDYSGSSAIPEFETKTNTSEDDQNGVTSVQSSILIVNDNTSSLLITSMCRLYNVRH